MQSFKIELNTLIKEGKGQPENSCEWRSNKKTIPSVQNLVKDHRIIIDETAQEIRISSESTFTIPIENLCLSKF